MRFLDSLASDFGRLFPTKPGKLLTGSLFLAGDAVLDRLRCGPSVRWRYSSWQMPPTLRACLSSMNFMASPSDSRAPLSSVNLSFHTIPDEPYLLNVSTDLLMNGVAILLQTAARANRLSLFFYSLSLSARSRGPNWKRTWFPVDKGSDESCDEVGTGKWPSNERSDV